MQQVIKLIHEASVLNADECYRIFHGRGQSYAGLEFLTVDWFPSLIWVCLFNDPGDDWLKDFKAALDEFLDASQFQGSIQIQYRYRQGCPVELVAGDLISALKVKENGLSYHVKFGNQQNVGLFLDMANGRQWLQSRADNANVLNLFSYTCGFSVAAIAGGARQVVNADMAKGALSWGRDNHRLNDHPMDRVKFFAHDVLRSWGKFKKYGPYDFIVVDPPSFQKGSFVAKKDYAKMARRFQELLAEDGKVLACLNAPELDTVFLKTVMLENDFRFVERLANPESFKEIDPEKGLKVMVFER